MSSKKENQGRLRDLIRAIRACKTAAEERAVVAQESSEIRDTFRMEHCPFRHRNVAKLMFIQMLGYPTQFGQVECLKLIASTNFTEKRVGYLGLVQLLNEQNEVLMMITNTIQRDLQPAASQQVLALALATIANIATAEMCRDLYKDVITHLTHSSSFIRKKAGMAAVRIVKKCPDLIEDFMPKINGLMEDRSHGVLIATVSLSIEILQIDPSWMQDLKNHNSTLVKVLKNLLLSGYAPEHDISGITDPFLQTKILTLLRTLGRDDSVTSEEMNDTLAQVATNTESAKNAGNSILYECVKTIMDIESTSGLRVLAINIMGRFLLNRDNNIRYVALKTMQRVVKIDAAAVTRHRNTIMDCLRDPDLSIRKKALELTYSIINVENVKSLVKEMINYLLLADAEFKEALVTKICAAVEHFSPTKKWHVDIVIKVLSLGGNYVTDEVIASTAHLVAGTPELQEYTVRKLYHALFENMEQHTLCLLGTWCIGEYGHFLPRGTEEPISEEAVLGLLERVMGFASSNQLKEYVLTALIKLTIRLPGSMENIRSIITQSSNSISIEIQQRACEYLQLLENQWDTMRRGLLEAMPALQKEGSDATVTAEVGEIRTETPVAVTAPVTQGASVEPSAAVVTDGPNLLDLDLLMDPTPAPAVSAAVDPTVAAPISTNEALMDIFAGTPAVEPAVATAPPVMNLFETTPPATVPTIDPTADLEFEEFHSAAPANLELIAYEDEHIRVDFTCTKPDATTPNVTSIDAKISTKSAQTISEFNL